jgi:hypothetical protein
MLMVAVPPTRLVGAEVYPPLERVTLPVAVGFPVPPFTVTVTGSSWAVVMLDGDGVTVTLGVSKVTVTEVEPVALL